MKGPQYVGVLVASSCVLSYSTHCRSASATWKELSNFQFLCCYFSHSSISGKKSL